jgi:LysR family glycine cleavage system transcriptional activator
MVRLNRVSLRARRAVEAVTRNGTLARAAEDLGVSPGAVSQQVAKAEATLGMQLFRRTPGGMEVTEGAEAICRHIVEGFARIEAALGEADRQKDNVLTVSVAPVFAARWLIWRLSDFQAAHPDVKVRLDASLALVDPGASDIELCIRVGRGDWPGVSAERLFSQVVFPVCSPDLAGRLHSPIGLLTVPIIREPRPNFGWEDWLDTDEPSPSSLPDGAVYSDASLCLDAAISGGGVFLTFETLAADALAHGRVVEPFRRRRTTRNAYWLVSAPGRRMSRPAQLFRSWLKARIDGAGFGQTRG